jgi:hypothetical protein
MNLKKKTNFLFFILIFLLGSFGRGQIPEATSPRGEAEKELLAYPPPAQEEGGDTVPPGTQVQRAPMAPAPSRRASRSIRERNQFFWQPLKGMSAVTVTGEDENNNYTTSNGAVTSTTTEQIPTYSLIYSYGITSIWAVSLDLSTSPNQTQTTTSGTETDTSSGGPNNVALTFKNTTPFGRWNLHYGLRASYSLDVDQPASESTSGNNYTGGDGATLYLGTSYNVFKKSFLGFRGEYIYNGTRTIDPNRSITNARQRSGGNESEGTAFFEWHIYPFLFDCQATYTWIASGQTINTTTTNNYDAYTSTTQDVGVQLFFSRKLMARLDGSLDQISQITSGTALQNSHVQTSVMLTARDEF